MARDLVRWSGWAQEEIHDEWDRPPVEERERDHPLYDHKKAQEADRDAAKARQRGDSTFAAVREADAGDLRATRGDWGDLRTWVWIAAMCLGFLAVTAFVYFLPYGRHNQNDGPAPTPTIRVY